MKRLLIFFLLSLTGCIPKYVEPVSNVALIEFTSSDVATPAMFTHGADCSGMRQLPRDASFILKPGPIKVAGGVEIAFSSAAIKLGSSLGNGMTLVEKCNTITSFTPSANARYRVNFNGFSGACLVQVYKFGDTGNTEQEISEPSARIRTIINQGSLSSQSSFCAPD